MSDDTTKQRDELILPLNVDVEIVKNRLKALRI